MKALELKVTKRDKTGNGPARVMRREGFVPAVLYGPGKPTEMLTASSKALEDLLNAAGPGQVMVELSIENGSTEKRLAMLKELQMHPISEAFIHVDFYEIDMKRKITVKIPVTTTGVAKGVELGGLLSHVRRELEVTCLPGDIPDMITVDITDLDIGDAIHLADIPLPEEVEIDDSVNYTVVSIVAPAVEEEEVEEDELEEGEEAEGEGGEEESAEAKESGE